MFFSLFNTIEIYHRSHLTVTFGLSSKIITIQSLDRSEIKTIDFTRRDKITFPRYSTLLVQTLNGNSF